MGAPATITKHGAAIYSQNFFILIGRLQAESYCSLDSFLGVRARRADRPWRLDPLQKKPPGNSQEGFLAISKLTRRLAFASCASQADLKRQGRWQRVEVRREVGCYSALQK